MTRELLRQVRDIRQMAELVENALVERENAWLPETPPPDTETPGDDAVADTGVVVARLDTEIVATGRHFGRIEKRLDALDQRLLDGQAEDAEMLETRGRSCDQLAKCVRALEAKQEADAKATLERFENTSEWLKAHGKQINKVKAKAESVGAALNVLVLAHEAQGQAVSHLSNRVQALETDHGKRLDTLDSRADHSREWHGAHGKRIEALEKLRTSWTTLASSTVCLRCTGSGLLYSDDSGGTCPDCGGTGRLRKET